MIGESIIIISGILIFFGYTIYEGIQAFKRYRKWNKENE